VRVPKGYWATETAACSAPSWWPRCGRRPPIGPGWARAPGSTPPSTSRRQCQNFLNLPRSFDEMLARPAAIACRMVGWPTSTWGQLPRDLRRRRDANARTKVLFSMSPEGRPDPRAPRGPKCPNTIWSHLGAYQAAARLVVDGEGDPRAVTLRTVRPSPADSRRGEVVRQAARMRHGPGGGGNAGRVPGRPAGLPETPAPVRLGDPIEGSPSGDPNRGSDLNGIPQTRANIGTSRPLEGDPMERPTWWWNGVERQGIWETAPRAPRHRDVDQRVLAVLSRLTDRDRQLCSSALRASGTDYSQVADIGFTAIGVSVSGSVISTDGARRPLPTPDPTWGSAPSHWVLGTVGAALWRPTRCVEMA